MCYLIRTIEGWLHVMLFGILCVLVHFNMYFNTFLCRTSTYSLILRQAHANSAKIKLLYIKKLGKQSSKYFSVAYFCLVIIVKQ